MKNILVTGSKGFIAKNLIKRLSENSLFKIVEFSRNNNLDDLPNTCKGELTLFFTLLERLSLKVKKKNLKNQILA